MNWQLSRLCLLFISFSLYMYGDDFCCNYHLDDDHNNTFAHSFMFTRPLTQESGIAASGWNSVIHYPRERPLRALQTYVIYQKSVRCALKNAAYFLPHCKDSMMVAGDEAPGRYMRDIRAEWIGINDPHFQGSFTLEPTQQQWGIFLELYSDLSTLSSFPLSKDYFISVSTPIIFVENNIHFREQKTAPTVGPDARDIIRAFNQSSWRYGRISGEAQSKVGLGEINVRVGRAYRDDSFYEFLYYTGIRIPTAHAQDAKYLFHPFVGNNKHFGFYGGISLQFPLTSDCAPFAVAFFGALESTFFLDNHQERTYDLRHKPFSRYLLFNIEGGQPDQFLPGVNILTLRTRVRPYGMAEANIGWRVYYKNMYAEAVYSIWGHARERLELLCCLPERYGIAGTGATSEGKATSASTSTIAQQASNDKTFVPIVTGDIDVRSAAAQSAINHTIRGAFNYIHHGKCTDGLIGIGAFWEFAQRNSALECGGFWIKGAIAF
jgi:hypothetical protein